MRAIVAGVAFAAISVAAWADPPLPDCGSQELADRFEGVHESCVLMLMRDGAEWRAEFHFLGEDAGEAVEIILYDPHGERRQDLHAQIEGAFSYPRSVDLDGDGTDEVEVFEETGNVNSYGTLFVVQPDGAYSGFDMPMYGEPVEDGIFFYWERSSAGEGTESYYALDGGAPRRLFSLHLTHPEFLLSLSREVTPENVCRVELAEAGIEGGLGTDATRASYCPDPEEM